MLELATTAIDPAAFLDGERESIPLDCGPSPDLAAPKSSAHPVTVMSNYRHSLPNPAFVPRAVRMALIIGSLVFSMNHGKALLQNEMNRDRWLSGALSFVMPYLVSIYGQTQCQISLSDERKS